jgi:hypothetical protein
MGIQLIDERKSIVGVHYIRCYDHLYKQMKDLASLKQVKIGHQFNEAMQMYLDLEENYMGSKSRRKPKRK